MSTPIPPNVWKNLERAARLAQVAAPDNPIVRSLIEAALVAVAASKGIDPWVPPDDSSEDRLP